MKANKPFIRDNDTTYSTYNRALEQLQAWVDEAPDTELDKVMAV